MNVTKAKAILSGLQKATAKEKMAADVMLNNLKGAKLQKTFDYNKALSQESIKVFNEKMHKADELILKMKKTPHVPQLISPKKDSWLQFIARKIFG